MKQLICHWYDLFSATLWLLLGFGRSVLYFKTRALRDLAGDDFTVLIIPHTLTATTFGRLAPGDRLNLEVDLMARYAARLIEARQ